MARGESLALQFAFSTLPEFHFPSFPVRALSRRRTRPAAAKRKTLAAFNRKRQPFRLLNATRRLRGRERSSRRQKSKSLKEENCSLRRSAPHELATLSLAVLDVDIPPRILQAAILKNAVHKHTLIENNVLVFKRSVFVSSHIHEPSPLLRHLEILSVTAPLRLAALLKYFGRQTRIGEPITCHEMMQSLAALY